MDSCGWNIARGWKRIENTDLDNSYLTTDVDIGRDADDEGWLFWHIELFIMLFSPDHPFWRMATEEGCIFNIIFLL